MTTQSSLSQSLAKTAAVTGGLLLIPFTVQFFSGDVNWTLFDFVAAGIMIFGTGASYVLISRQSENLTYRIASAVALFTALFLIWVNLAVGVIGSEDNTGNVMYFGVLLILAVGILAAQFNARGMAYALFTTALAQGVTIPVALTMDMQSLPGSSVAEIVLINGMFIVLFGLAGILFLKASDQKLPGDES